MTSTYVTPCAVQGLVFGVGTDKGVIKLFDVRSYAQGPFDAFTVCVPWPGAALTQPLTL